jgi:hypothetical protein
MTADRPFTRRPFTVAICTACDSDVARALLPDLRAVVRDCPHGVLVSTGCLLGSLTCATRTPVAGVMLLMQPCTPERVPTGAVSWIGPVQNTQDADAACAWIAAGRWDRVGLPPKLRGDRRLVRASAQN